MKPQPSSRPDFESRIQRTPQEELHEETDRALIEVIRSGVPLVDPATGQPIRDPDTGRMVFKPAPAAYFTAAVRRLKDLGIPEALTPRSKLLEEAQRRWEAGLLNIDPLPGSTGPAPSKGDSGDA
jgi:hypothetical protein